MARWKTEAEMCAAMVPVYRGAGFVVYPETSGWDQLLVREDGFQVGIQAKLRPNFRVLIQAREGARVHKGPDVRAVLVPSFNVDFREVALELGIAPLDAEVLVYGQAGHHSLTGAAHILGYLVDAAPKDESTERCPLPPFVPDLPAGVPAPRRMTDWRIRAIALCGRLRQRGYVTRADFNALRLRVATWLETQNGSPPWLIREGTTVPARYVATPGVKLPDVGYQNESPA